VAYGYHCRAKQHAMPKLNFTLTEQFSDPRSNEIAYRFEISNQGNLPVDVLSINQRIPDGVTLSEVRNPTFVQVQTKHSELCKQLSDITSDQLLSCSEAVRKKYLATHLETWRELMSASGFMRFYGRMFMGTLKKNMEAQQRKSDKFTFKIEDKKDADVVYEKFFSDEGTDETLRSLFILKKEKLAELEATMGTGTDKTSLATVEPGSFFGATYVFKFQRNQVEPRKFNIVIEGTYSEHGKPEKHTGIASASLIISPNPLTLSIVAMISAILGVTLRLALKGIVFPSHEFLISSLSASILALVFYNVYEFTEIGKKIAIGIGWRGALAIGTLCGLMQERIVTAIQTLAGFK
jgi:hypothetical protein